MDSKDEASKREDEVLDKIREIVNMASDGEYIYRGQPDAAYPHVSSTLYRVMEDSYPEIKGINLNMNRVQEEELKAAWMFTSEDYDNEKMLSRIQHYSGDTNLIDFTKDCLVALFFACSQKGGEEGGRDGKVFLLKTSNLKDSEIEMITPVHPPNRVTAQKSVFVQSRTGIIRESMMDSIGIPLDLKQSILDYLRVYHGISEYSIYNDLHGYIRNRKAHKNAVMEGYLGIIYGDKDEKIQSPKEKDDSLEKAIEHFGKAILLAPNYAAAYNNRGNAKRASGDIQGAINDYNKSIELNPNYVEAYYNRGIAKDDLGDMPGAISDYDKVIELNPKDAEAYNNRGADKRESGDNKGAISDYDKSIALNPNDVEPYNNRGNAKRELGDVLGAISDFDKAIEMNPYYVGAYSNRGVAKNDRGDTKWKSGDMPGAISDYKDAISDQDKSIALDSNYVAAYNNRGASKGKFGDNEGAIKDFSIAINLDSSFAQAYFNRGAAFVNMKDFQQALPDLENAKKLALQQNKQDIVDLAQKAIKLVTAEVNKS